MSKVIVITGASRGIGRNIAYNMALDGNIVIANYNNSEEDMLSLKNELMQKNINLDIYKADVSNSHQARSLVNYAIERYEKIDVLINNAGIAEEKLFTEITDVKTGEVVTSNDLVSGRVYKEKVFISSTRNREYVAVRAPVPAGCEIMNAAFVTTGSIPDAESEKHNDYYDDYGYDDYDYDSYYRNYNWGLSYQGIYDSEVQYFWDYFPRGFQKVEFMFRASRCGNYNTPSATAECMYQEEIFGRSNGKVWTIKQN